MKHREVTLTGPEVGCLNAGADLHLDTEDRLYVLSMADRGRPRVDSPEVAYRSLSRAMVLGLLDGRRQRVPYEGCNEVITYVMAEALVGSAR